MGDTDPEPLPDWIEDAYGILAAHLTKRRKGISREQACELLLAEDDLEDEPADAKYAIRYFLNHGWFYEVNQGKSGEGHRARRREPRIQQYGPA